LKRSFDFFLDFVLVFYFTPHKMEDVGLPSQKKGMTENIFAGVFTALVKAIHIELSNERVDIPVSEIFGEDMFLKLINLFDGELTSVGHPVNDAFVFFVLKNFEALLDEVSHRRIWNLIWHSL